MSHTSTSLSFRYVCARVHKSPVCVTLVSEHRQRHGDILELLVAAPHIQWPHPHPGLYHRGERLLYRQPRGWAARRCWRALKCLMILQALLPESEMEDGSSLLPVCHCPRLSIAICVNFMFILSHACPGLFAHERRSCSESNSLRGGPCSVRAEKCMTNADMRQFSYICSFSLFCTILRTKSIV